jgi:MFS family permease
MNSLIGARVLQGIGAAGRQTVGLIIIFDLVPKESQGLWIGFFTLSLSLGMAAGPVLGALISVQTTWRWLFWITLVLTAVTSLLSVFSMRHMPFQQRQETNISTQLKQVDYLGCFLAVSVSSLICISVELGDKIFPWKVS